MSNETGTGPPPDEAIPANGSTETSRDEVIWGQGNGSNSQSQTVREGSNASENWVPIPGSLQGRYRYLSTLSGGGEANLFLATDVENSDVTVVLKLYNAGIKLNEEAMRTIQQIPESPDGQARVVKLLEWGVAAETQQSYEIQEYLEAGDLVQFIDASRAQLNAEGALVTEIIDQISASVAAFHDAGLLHHDVKPSNFLVRTTKPQLNLVLSDFGLAVAGDRTVFLSRRMGTIAYDSPESLGAGQGGPKRDYWALGITIAEIAGGRHPFSRSSDASQLLSDETIRDHLYAWRPIDFSSVTDERVSLLCRGLTRYDEDNRWGSSEVADWLAGEDPEVIDDASRGGGVSEQSSGVLFAGKRRPSRQALAAAISEDWRAAVSSVATDERRVEFLGLIASSFGSGGLAELEDRWQSDAPGLDRAVCDLLVLLDPTETTPVVKGYELTPKQLAPLARAVSDGDPDAAALIETLFAQPCLTSLSRLPGLEPLSGLDTGWHAATARFDQLIDQAKTNGAIFTPNTTNIRATLLGALSDEELASTLIRDRDSALVENPEAAENPWFAEISTAADDDLPAVLVARYVVSSVCESIREAKAVRDRDRREKLAQIRNPLCGWLAIVAIGNIAFAILLGASIPYKANYFRFALKHSWLIQTIATVFRWSGWWPVPAIGALVAIFSFFATRGTEDPRRIRLAQITAIVSTVTVPFLAPFGAWFAISRRSQRLGASSSPMFKFALYGMGVAALSLILLVINRTSNAFHALFRHWPASVRTLFKRDWPHLLTPSSLSSDIDKVFLVMFLLAGIATFGMWFSYERKGCAGVEWAESAGVLSGVFGVVILLPLLLTIVAWLGILALIIGGCLLIAWIACIIFDQ